MIDSVSDIAGAAADLKKTRRRKNRSRADARQLDRLPPHSPEAEQGVLGCVLLSPNECMGESSKNSRTTAAGLLRSATPDNLRGLATMYDAREAIDIITLQQKLKDKGLLDQIGGIAYLSQLQDSVPSAANLTYYLEIMQEKFLLRRMIATCTDVVGRVYDYEGDVETLLDEVEKEILRINESRAQSSTASVKELVGKAILTVENYFGRQGTLNGLGTGFPDLDRMTDGLHGQEMIVIAARPSMGKCLSFDSEIVLADGSVKTIRKFTDSGKPNCSRWTIV